MTIPYLFRNPILPSVVSSPLSLYLFFPIRIRDTYITPILTVKNKTNLVTTFIILLIQSFIKCILLSGYYVSSIVIGTKDKAINNSVMFPDLMEIYKWYFIILFSLV